MKKRILVLICLLLVQLFVFAQENVIESDFKLDVKKKKSILYYKNTKIKELNNTRLSVFKVHKSYLVLKVNPFFTSDDSEFFLINKNGEFLFEKPFKNRDFEFGINSKFSIMTFPDCAYLVDSELNEISGTRCSKIIKSNYNDEKDLSIVWQKYGKKSPFYLYEMEFEQPDKSIKYGYLDLATGMVIAKPIFGWIGKYGFIEHGIYPASLYGTKEVALYDFNGNKISDYYDGIKSVAGALEIEKNKLQGLMNLQGKEFIKPIYKDIQAFADGKNFLCINSNDKIGIVDISGKVVMPFEFTHTNYRILDYPMGNYIPITMDKLYGYFGIREKKLVKNYEYYLAGPEVNNVANVTHIDGETQIISFNDYSTGALLTNVEYNNQIKVLANYLSEKRIYFFEKYKNAVNNYKTREEALAYFYPYYRELCTEIIPSVNIRIAVFKKEFGHLFTYEEVKAIDEILKAQTQLKKKMDENIEKVGGQVIYLKE